MEINDPVKDLDLNPYGPKGKIISITPLIVKFGSWEVKYNNKEIKHLIGYCKGCGCEIEFGYDCCPECFQS